MTFRKEHPSFGMIKFSRIQGNPGKMFGSELPQHGHFIELAILPGKRYRSCNTTNYMGDHRRGLISVWLSTAQFADLITNMNVGDGVPCTVSRFNGELVERVPSDEQTNAERIESDFKEKVGSLIQSLTEESNKAQELLLKKGAMSMKARREVVEHLERIHREIGSNIPFVLRCFQEATEKTSTHAKAELDAMITQAIQSTGLKALAEGSFNEEDTKRLLLAPEDKGSDE